MTRLAVAVGAIVATAGISLGPATDAWGQTAAATGSKTRPTTYAGRALVDVLQDLNRRGLRISLQHHAGAAVAAGERPPARPVGATTTRSGARSTWPRGATWTEGRVDRGPDVTRAVGAAGRRARGSAWPRRGCRHRRPARRCPGRDTGARTARDHKRRRSLRARRAERRHAAAVRVAGGLRAGPARGRGDCRRHGRDRRCRSRPAPAPTRSNSQCGPASRSRHAPRHPSSSRCEAPSCRNCAGCWPTIRSAPSSRCRGCPPATTSAPSSRCAAARSGRWGSRSTASRRRGWCTVPAPWRTPARSRW